MAAEVRRVMALGQLTSLPSDLDNLVIVDVDDTTQAASGSTKRITVADLLGDAQKISNHAATSVIGRSVDSVGVAADIVAGANGVLRRAGTGALSFSTLVTGNIGDSAVTNAKLAQMAAQTVKGRAADTGTPQDIVAGSNGVLRRSGTGNLEFGTLVAGNIASDAITTDKILNANVTDAKLASNAVTTVKILDANVTNAKLANMVQATIKGRVTPGTGAPQDLTAPQVRAILNVADGANAYVHPNHTGDVTSAGGGATTIADNVVTNAKLADMVTARIKGRVTAGTGDPEDLTAAQARAIVLPIWRKGGHATNWATPGTNLYSPSGGVMIQSGVHQGVGVASGNVTTTGAIEFPVPFSGTPIVMATALTNTSVFATTVVSVSSLEVNIYYQNVGSTTATPTIHWLAIGPA